MERDELVTPAKRRRLMAARRAAERSNAAELRDADASAWRALARALIPVAEVEAFGMLCPNCEIARAQVVAQVEAQNGGHEVLPGGGVLPEELEDDQAGLNWRSSAR